MSIVNGCPVRIRTSIDGVRVRSLTIRRRGNVGAIWGLAPGLSTNCRARCLPSAAACATSCAKHRTSGHKGLPRRQNIKASTHGMGDHSPKMPYRQDRPARSAPTPGKTPGAGRARWPEARHFAALDLGTNNCRLLIARPQGNGFAVVDAFSRIVRLGEGLAATGRAERRGDRPYPRRAEGLCRQAQAPQRRPVALGRDRGVPAREQRPGIHRARL